jgi:hypothetical protein
MSCFLLIGTRGPASPLSGLAGALPRASIPFPVCKLVVHKSECPILCSYYVGSAKPSDPLQFPKSALSKRHGPKIGQYMYRNCISGGNFLCRGGGSIWIGLGTSGLTFEYNKIAPKIRWARLVEMEGVSCTHVTPTNGIEQQQPKHFSVQKKQNINAENRRIAKNRSPPLRPPTPVSTP